MPALPSICRGPSSWGWRSLDSFKFREYRSIIVRCSWSIPHTRVITTNWLLRALSCAAHSVAQRCPCKLDVMSKKDYSLGCVWMEAVAMPTGIPGLGGGHQSLNTQTLSIPHPAFSQGKAAAEEYAAFWALRKGVVPFVIRDCWHETIPARTASPPPPSKRGAPCRAVHGSTESLDVAQRMCI